MHDEFTVTMPSKQILKLGTHLLHPAEYIFIILSKQENGHSLNVNQCNNKQL